MLKTYAGPPLSYQAGRWHLKHPSSSWQCYIPSWGGEGVIIRVLEPWRENKSFLVHNIVSSRQLRHKYQTFAINKLWGGCWPWITPPRFPPACSTVPGQCQTHFIALVAAYCHKLPLPTPHKLSLISSLPVGFPGCTRAHSLETPGMSRRGLPALCWPFASPAGQIRTDMGVSCPNAWIGSRREATQISIAREPQPGSAPHGKHPPRETLSCCHLQGGAAINASPWPPQHQTAPNAWVYTCSAYLCMQEQPSMSTAIG